MPKKQFNLWRQISLKHLTNSVKCHVSASKIMTYVTLNNNIYKEEEEEERKG